MGRERAAFSERVPNLNSNPNSNSNSNPFPDSNPSSISTVFVSNIPAILDVFGLRGIFSRVRRVVDASIPVKQLGKSRFGFVKFENQGVALMSIKALSNKIVRGSKILVHCARRDLSRGRQVYQNPDRHHHSSVTPLPAFNVNRSADAEVLESLKSNLAEEISKLIHLRTALKSILGNFEELVDSKCVRTIIGVLSEVAENLKTANPNFNLDSDPAHNSQPLSSPDGLYGRRVGVSGSYGVDVEVVEDSIPVEMAGSKELEEGEIHISEIKAEAGDRIDVEAMDLEAAQPRPFSDCVFVPPADQPCFSFKSKSKRRRKRTGKSRASQPIKHPKPGDKRWLSCQGILPSQGCAKKVKRSTESNRQRQEVDDPGTEAMIHSPNVSVDGEGVGESIESSEDDEEEKESSVDEEEDEESSDFSASPNPRDEIGGSTEALASPTPSPLSDGVWYKDLVSATPEKLVGISEDPDLERPHGNSIVGNLSISSTESEKRAVRKSMEIGNLVGVKVIGCPVGAMKRISRNLKRNRRLHSPATSISGGGLYGGLSGVQS